MPSKLAPHFQKIPQSFDQWLAAGTAAFKFAMGQGASSQLPAGVLAVGRNEDPRNWKELMKEGHSAKKTAEMRFKSRQSEYEHPANARIDVWEDDNEVVPDNADEWKFFNEYSIAMMEHYESIGKHRANFSFAVGTPEIADWKYLLEAIRHANKHGHYIAVHEYMAMEQDLGVGWNQVNMDTKKKERTHWHGRVDANNQPILAYPYGYGVLRYRAIYDRFLRPEGLENTPLIITECGCDVISFTPKGMSNGSWSAHKKQWVRDGKNPEQHYAQMLQWYDSELRKDAYVKGAFIFTVGNSGQWADFEIAGTGVEQHLLTYIKSQRAVVDVPFDKPGMKPAGTDNKDNATGNAEDANNKGSSPVDPTSSSGNNLEQKITKATVKLQQTLSGFNPDVNAIKLLIRRKEGKKLTLTEEHIIPLPDGDIQIDLMLLKAVFEKTPVVPATPPADPNEKSVQPTSTSPDSRLQGIDVSSHQSPAKMDHKQMKKAGVEFAFVRASRGSSVGTFWEKDTAYLTHFAKLKEAGILRGSYHVLYENDPEGQARKFYDVLQAGELPPVIDIEKERYTGKLTADIVQRFMKTWESLGGQRPIIYTNKSTWNELIKNPSWSRDYILWVANWVSGDKPLAVPKPWGADEWHIWQYKKGQIAGYDGQIDLDWFKGNLEDLKRLFKWGLDEFEIEDYGVTEEEYVNGWITSGRLDVQGDQAVVTKISSSTFVNVRTGPGKAKHPIPVGTIKNGTRVEITGALDPEFMYYPVKVRRVDLLATIDTPPKTPVSPISGKAIDLLKFMRGDPSWSFEVKHPDGSQERFQTQEDPYNPQAWYYVKNQLWEHWRAADGKIWLCSDVSPQDASDGTRRYYIVSKDGQYGAPYAQTSMRVGEEFYDGGHKVQFYAKKSGAAHPQNSGQDSNKTTLISYEKNFTFNTYNQALTLDEVIAVKGNTETHWFAIHNGVSLGRVAWRSAWGRSEISELHTPGNRTPYERERSEPLQAFVRQNYKFQLA